MDIPLITIQVTPDIALKIRGMAEHGVFSIITGNASLNFHEGALKSIKTEVISHIKSYPHLDSIDTSSLGLIIK